jgi:hypothetical protein
MVFSARGGLSSVASPARRHFRISADRSLILRFPGYTAATKQLSPPAASVFTVFLCVVTDEELRQLMPRFNPGGGGSSEIVVAVRREQFPAI